MNQGDEYFRPDYRQLVHDVTGIPMEQIGVVPGDNLVLITTSIATGFTGDQAWAIKNAFVERLGDGAPLLKLLTTARVG